MNENTVIWNHHPNHQTSHFSKKRQNRNRLSGISVTHRVAHARNMALGQNTTRHRSDAKSLARDTWFLTILTDMSTDLRCQRMLSRRYSRGICSRQAHIGSRRRTAAKVSRSKRERWSMRSSSLHLTTSKPGRESLPETAKIHHRNNQKGVHRKKCHWYIIPSSLPTIRTSGELCRQECPFIILGLSSTFLRAKTKIILTSWKSGLFLTRLTQIPTTMT